MTAREMLGYTVRTACDSARREGTSTGRIKAETAERVLARIESDNIELRDSELLAISDRMNHAAGTADRTVAVSMLEQHEPTDWPAKLVRDWDGFFPTEPMSAPRGGVTFGSWRFVITDETGEELARGTFEEFDAALRAIAARLEAETKQQGQLNITWERV